MFNSVDLPLPEGPSSTRNSGLEQLEADAAQRVHVDLAHVVDLGDVAREEHRCHGAAVARGSAAVFVGTPATAR